MEMVLNNGFCEMSQGEMEVIDGGFWGGFLACAIADGIITAATGKGTAQWISNGIVYVWDNYFTVNCY